jgi:hypothetical protein
MNTGTALRSPTLERKSDHMPKPKMERIQQTINADDASDIRNLSVLEFRTFADELRYVIRLGLNVAKERLRFEHSGPRL